MNEQHLPPADAPDLKAPYNWAWFKHHHLTNLKTAAEAFNLEYIKKPMGKGLSQDAIKRVLDLTDNMIQFHPWLPATRWGKVEMENIIEARNNLESNFIDKETDKASYKHTHEIDSMASAICNYMDTMCEDE